MASLNTLRTKFGVLLSVIIAGALLAFILSLKTEMGFSGNDPKVGEIDGEKVLYSEYLDAYENVKAQMGGDAAYTDEMANQLIARHGSRSLPTACSSPVSRRWASRSPTRNAPVCCRANIRRRIRQHLR